MKCMRPDVDLCEFFVRHPSSHRVLPAVHSTGNFESLGGGRRCNQSHHGFIVTERLSTPIGRDKRKQAMFYFVPFAGSGRKVANADDQSRLIRKLLHLYFPQAQPITIATAPIGRDDELSGFGIEPPAFATPPPANGGHGKSPGVMICSY